METSMADKETQTLNQGQDTAGRRTEGSLSRLMLTLVVVALLTSTAALIVSRDMLVRDQTQTTLQMAADRAAMAGAAYLPGWPMRARRAAEQSAELSGFSRSNMVDAEPAPNGKSFRVTLKCAAPVLLLGLLPSGSEVTAISTMGSPQARRFVGFDHFAPDEPPSRAAAEQHASASALVAAKAFD